MHEEHIDFKEYMETRFKLFEQNIEKALQAVGSLAALHNTSHAQEHQASQRAIDKAEEAVNMRLGQMNEIRGALRDTQTLFIPRTEAEANFTSLSQRLDTVSERMRALELAAKDYLTITAFNRWTEREEAQVRDDRKQRATILVGVGLSLLGTVVSIVLALT